MIKLLIVLLSATTILCGESPIITAFITCKRTGTHWTAYCLKNLTSYTSIPVNAIPSTSKKQTGLYRCHSHLPIDLNYFKFPNVRLLTILRNYREIVLRDLPLDTPIENVPDATRSILSLCYLPIIKFYDKVPKNQRFMYRYEDLINNPSETLNAILDYLDQPTDKLSHFIKNIDRHRKQSIKDYNNLFKNSKKFKQSKIKNYSISGGTASDYHSQRASKEVIEIIDRTTREYAGEQIWDTYLAQYCNPL